jgi:two-component system, cell cycle response regulator
MRVRTRLLIGMAVMLLPLVALGLGVFWSLQSVMDALDDVILEVSREMAPVARLQGQIRRARIYVHDSFIPGFGGPEEQRRFRNLARMVDAAFVEASASHFDLHEEASLFRSARAEWEQGREIGTALLAQPSRGWTVPPVTQLQHLDAHFERAMEHLDQIELLAQRELAHNLSLARDARRQALLVIVTVFAVGLAAAAAVGLGLARSILDPLRLLKEGADQFRGGELSHRVPLTSRDEFGQLGRTFNTMAETLQRDQAELADLSHRDGLTDLDNYREFRRQLTEETMRSSRYGRPFSLLMLDLDHFKQVNDTYGHLAGDEALRGLAALIRREVRPVDRIARYGGEEFAIILPETTTVGALATAERIREIVATRPILVNGEREVALTVSIGVGTYPDDADTEEKLVGAADQALYVAKNGGRNRVIHFQHEK